MSNFLTGNDIITLSKQDEERYIKAMKEKEDRDRKNEDLRNMRMVNQRNDNLKAL